MISDISFCILKSTFELFFLFKAIVNYIQDMCDAGGIFVVKIYFGNQCQKTPKQEITHEMLNILFTISVK